MAYVLAKNINTVIGRIPNFTNRDVYHFKEAQDENHQDFLMGQISVDTSQKDKETGYAISCLHDFKCWGPTAKYIYEYIKPGQEVAMTYELRKDAPYEKDGQTVYPGSYLYVIAANSVGPRDKAEGGEKSAPAAKKPAAGHAAPRVNPLKRRHNVL